MKTCLIVEDSGVIRRVERRMMEELGFTVDEAPDGQIALEKCAVNLPAVILLDWVMPGMDGMAFLRALRAMPGGHSPRVIFCTSQSDLASVAEAAAAGADEFVMKPFDRETLAVKLTDIGIR
jgi:two-component system chemotaxis response regulator CheY